MLSIFMRLPRLRVYPEMFPDRLCLRLVFQGFGLRVGDQSIHEFFDFAFHGSAEIVQGQVDAVIRDASDRKSTRLNSSHWS